MAVIEMLKPFIIYEGITAVWFHLSAFGVKSMSLFVIENIRAEQSSR